MRYLFRGLIRDTGRPVEGHVEAAFEEEAYNALSTNGVVTESLAPDPRPLNLNEELPTSPEFAEALESAFDSSSSQVDFDALSDRYRGKKVWVIDRDKIRRRIAQVVDAALALAAQHGEGAGQARERVASAIQGLFADNRNIASERNAESIAGVRFNAGGMPSPAAPPAVNFAPSGSLGAPSAGHSGLEEQIGRLTTLVRQAEATLAAIAAAARRGGGDGGGPRRQSFVRSDRGEEQNAVLLEIFKSNLELVRGIQQGLPASAAASMPDQTPPANTPGESQPGAAPSPQSDAIPDAEEIAGPSGPAENN